MILLTTTIIRRSASLLTTQQRVGQAGMASSEKACFLLAGAPKKNCRTQDAKYASEKVAITPLLARSAGEGKKQGAIHGNAGTAAGQLKLQEFFVKWEGWPMSDGTCMGASQTPHRGIQAFEGIFKQAKYQIRLRT